jgi:3-isopropylmalate/(R)-2-methylmalate dehydratase large subunit
MAERTVRFPGRILFLTEDPELVRRQIAGEDLLWDPSIPLRDDISTDEITPGWTCYYFDERLGDYPYVGLTCRGEKPVEKGNVRAGGFSVCVSGKRRGKGSSREQSPYAERCAGIRLVVAENIERIYRQNCQNLGVLTSTDFGLIDRIRRGEEIPLSEFSKGADAITREIVERGGLFPYNVARLAGEVTPPVPSSAPGPMTLAEKILARHFVADAASGRLGVPSVRPGDAGFVRTDFRFSHEYVTPMAASFFEANLGADAKVADPSTILFFRDHLTFLKYVMPPDRVAAGLLDAANELATRQADFARKQEIRLHGEVPSGGSEGICHSVMYQDYALPGHVIIGSDSHTPHSGALGCVAFGVGTTDVFNSWTTRDVRVTVPESVRVEIRGEKPAGVTAKDFMLAILAHPYVKDGNAIGKILEYTGEAVRALSVDERATMTNMAAEVGAFTGIVAPDEKTAEFLAAHRGMTRAEAARLCEGLVSDPDARWSETLVFDAEVIGSMVALPGDPGNGTSLSDLGDVPIEIAYGGSCTAGKRSDMDMYAAVCADAVREGRRVADGVTFWIQFGSQDVKRYCEEKGYLALFERAGAKTIDPSCGACINAGPGVSTRKDQVTVSAINRNFPGRSGPGQMYLASPYTVAASAFAGKIAEWHPGAGA